MKTESRSSALLTELLIVVAFFLLASTVLLQVFAAARERSAQAERISAAVAEAQNVADSMYAGADSEETLRALGFTDSGETWTRDDGDFLLTVTEERTEEAGGVMLHRSVSAAAPDGELLLTLPCSEWMGAGR